MKELELNKIYLGDALEVLKTFPNELDKKYVGIEINPEYIKIAEDRLKPLKNKLF